MSERYDYLESLCQECFGRREREVDRKTGRYDMFLPRCCLHKEQCERELMQGFEYTSDEAAKARRG